MSDSGKQHFAALALSHSDLAPWIFTAGIVPVLTVLSWSIVKSLMRGEYGLDIIAALSMTGTLLAGEALAGVVVALMYSGGLLLEDFAQGRAQREMTALLGRVARIAQTYRGKDLVETTIELLVPGDRLLIRAGEVVPADGTVESGSALLDESSLTGEALPVRRKAGAAVPSGVANGDAPFNLVASKTAALSTYVGVVRLVDAERLSKALMARLADRYAIGFLAVTLALTAAA